MASDAEDTSSSIASYIASEHDRSVTDLRQKAGIMGDKTRVTSV